MMNIIIPLLAIVVLTGAKKNIDINTSLDKKQTASINGFFVIMVFIRHFYQYISKSKFDVLSIIDLATGQLIVVSFMFFSGYALVKQWQKNKRYIDKIPQKIISLYLIFGITVVLFLTIGIISGNKYDITTVALSFIGMRSVGNSTWYIVAILFMWLFSYIAFKQNVMHPIYLLSIFIISYIILMSQIKEATFYNTVIAYLFGILVAFYEKMIISVLNKKYWLCLLLDILLIGVCFYLQRYFVVYEIMVLLFCTFLLLFSLKVRLYNNVLSWLSRYTLEIYLIQRIPMMIVQGKIKYSIVYFVICVLLTLGLALLWKKLYTCISSTVSNIIKHRGGISSNESNS
ncbi:acyltransferase family protein [Ruminococcus flavefaciens]|uniref:Acyltransferase family protein n=1 Tax=Ruminococcus flavefaciens TaxID=1265 RepID=A0A1M7GAG3_RUMFL|nr:acyltransferase family protein [Ruminococcus flavefaciens]SHM13088.1 Acyltransferase family protein [Ruminococcus flavefaciens]